MGPNGSDQDNIPPTTSPDLVILKKIKQHNKEFLWFSFLEPLKNLEKEFFIEPSEMV